MKTIAILFALTACNPFSGDGNDPADMVYVGEAHIARGCILHRPVADTVCTAHFDFLETPDQNYTCNPARQFDGEIGCCLVGPMIDDQIAMYWSTCDIVATTP